MMYDGIAIIRPVEVVIRASETPSAITDEGPADEASAIPENVVFIPETVPNRPTIGAVVIKTNVNGILRLREENI